MAEETARPPLDPARADSADSGSVHSDPGQPASAGSAAAQVPPHAAVARAPAEAPMGQTLLRGWRGRCPRCGEGGLFRAYLKVREECPACGQSFRGLRADDGPAYVTILIAGHLAIPLMYWGAEWENMWASVAAISGVVLVGSLALLPRVKGAFLGVLWRSA